jgi:hypothetical protein
MKLHLIEQRIRRTHGSKRWKRWVPYKGPIWGKRVAQADLLIIQEVQPKSITAEYRITTWRKVE